LKVEPSELVRKPSFTWNSHSRSS